MWVSVSLQAEEEEEEEMEPCYAEGPTESEWLRFSPGV